MKIESIPYDEKLFEIYMDKWDGLRAKTKEIHYIYIIKSLIVLAILNFFIPKKNENIYFFVVFKSFNHFLNSSIFII